MPSANLLSENRKSEMFATTIFLHDEYINGIADSMFSPGCVASLIIRARASCLVKGLGPRIVIKGLNKHDCSFRFVAIGLQMLMLCRNDNVYTTQGTYHYKCWKRYKSTFLIIVKNIQS
jgi:hypothetical protein